MRDASSQVLPLPAQASTTTLRDGSRARRISDDESDMDDGLLKLVAIEDEKVPAAQKRHDKAR